MLTYDGGSYDSPSIDLNLPAALTANDFNAPVTPAANQNQSQGFNFNDAISNVLKLFDTGVQVYKSVDQVTAGAASSNANEQKNAAQAQAQAAQAQVITISGTLQKYQNYLIIAAVGLAAVLIIPRLIKR